MAEKEGKSGNFHSVILFLKKSKNTKSVFAFFFKEKTKPFF